MPSDHPPAFCFERGQLYASTDGEAILLEGWPILRARRRKPREHWTEFSPAFRVVTPYRPKKKQKAQPQLELGLDLPVAHRGEPTVADQRRRAFDQFRFTMPKPIASRVEKFQSRQWSLLRLFHAREEALDLAEQNAALCFTLANQRVLVEPALRAAFESVVSISAFRQREIVQWLGFPGTDAAVRVLAKIAPESASIELLRLLRDSLDRPEVGKALAHLPSLNAGVLTLVCHPHLLAVSAPQLLAEVAEVPAEKYRASTAELLEETLGMMREIQPPKAFPKVVSRARLSEIHSLVSADYQRRRREATLTSSLAPPPLRGTCHIVPLCTVAELIEEGEEQNNCVGTYADRAQRGLVFIYRVLKPERATLSIVRNYCGDWAVGQLTAASNQEVGTSTRKSVESWLDQFALSA